MVVNPPSSSTVALRAPPPILRVWRSFDAFPMETLTKAYVVQTRGGHQRSVDDMETDRACFGASGNCFDLAYWLLHRFRAAAVRAYAVSDDIASKDAHVAVIAVGDDGRRFLCDLGDMWWQPMCIEVPQAVPVRGFFPAASVTVKIATSAVGTETLRINYHRPGAKMSAQRYDLTPLSADTLDAAAARNQAYLSQRLVEVRDFARRAHWESDGAGADWSTEDGLVPDGAFRSNTEAAQAIAIRTGMKSDYVAACLDAFNALGA